MTHSVLLIHGIGDKKPGKILKQYLKSIEKNTTRHLPKSDKKNFKTFCNDPAIFNNTFIGQHGSVRFSESRWESKLEKIGIFKKLSWIIKNFIPLVWYIILPADKEIYSRIFDEELKINDILIKFLGRILIPLLVSFVTIYTIITFSKNIIFLVTALILIFLFIIKILSLSSQVQMATLSDTDIGRSLIDHVVNDIKSNLSTAKTLTIVAHSQGGYLAHEALSSGEITEAEKKSISLITVGSGHKSINFIKLIQRSDNLRKNLNNFLLLFFFLEVFLIYSISEHSFINQFFIIDNTLLLLLGLPLLLTIAIFTSIYVSLAYSNNNGIDIGPVLNWSAPWGQLIIELAIFIIIITCIIRNFRFNDNLFSEVFEEKLEIINVDWINISTIHDPVARFNFPEESDQISNYHNPTTGFALLDHLFINYCWYGSPFSKLISKDILGYLTHKFSLKNYETKSVKNSRLLANEVNYRDIKNTISILILLFIFVLMSFITKGSLDLDLATLFYIPTAVLILFLLVFRLYTIYRIRWKTKDSIQGDEAYLIKEKWLLDSDFLEKNKKTIEIVLIRLALLVISYFSVLFYYFELANIPVFALNYFCSFTLICLFTVSSQFADYLMKNPKSKDIKFNLIISEMLYIIGYILIFGFWGLLSLPVFYSLYYIRHWIKSFPA